LALALHFQEGRPLNRPVFTVFTLLALLLAPPVFYSPQRAVAENEKKEDIAFRWAFGAIIKTAGEQRLVAITRDTELRTGDRLKMLVELKKKCYVYLFYCDERENLHMLFPYSLEQFSKNYEISRKYYIPDDNGWFQLDRDVGLETFYLLASSSRLMDLEEIYAAYVSADPSVKKSLAENTVAKIREIRKQRKKLTTEAERPVIIGGGTRGVLKGNGAWFPDIDPFAGEVRANDFYIKTFTIEHR